MRKTAAGFIMGIVLATGISVYADEGFEKIEAYLRPSLPITLDGKRINLESPPVMVDGSTYLKLRDVSLLTGLFVNWNDDTQTVELSTKQVVEVKMDIGTPLSIQPEPWVKVWTLDEIEQEIASQQKTIHFHERTIKIFTDSQQDTTDAEQKLQTARNRLAELEQEKSELLKK